MLLAATAGVGLIAVRRGLGYRPSPGAALIVLLVHLGRRRIPRAPDPKRSGSILDPTFRTSGSHHGLGVNRARWDGRLSRGLTCLLVGWAVCSSLHDRIEELKVRLHYSFLPAGPDGLFAEVMHHVPAGACVLFVGGQDAWDYELFAPWQGYPNHVVSWGKLPFDPTRMQQMIEEHQVTHILIQNDVAVDFQWEPSINTAPW